jgi:selenocysteine lyase/cysteine desulfurase
VIPNTQKHIASILGLKNPEQIVLAPNTHELSSRLLSLFLGRKELRILTTTNEFHSWRRQFLRLSEIPQVKVEQIQASQLLNQKEDFFQAFESALRNKPDLIFLSQVFFDSGLSFTDQDLKALADLTPKETLFVIDGYHGFAAIPTNLSELEGRVFYLGGGYKYGQGGEGVGFMVVPKGEWRPAYTGWYAEHAQLSLAPEAKVGYAPDGMAFLGATQDCSGFYRFNSVWDLFADEGISISGIHEYVLKLQKFFLQSLPVEFIQNWHLRPLFDSKLLWHGHFLTFEGATLEEAEECRKVLFSEGITIDRRGKNLRFGFGLYQDLEDVGKLCHCLIKVAKMAQ